MLCSDCAGISLGIYIKKYGYQGECRFCNKQKEKILPCNEVESFLLNAWSIYYEDADNCGSSVYEVLDSYGISELLEDKETLELEDTNEQFLEELESDFSEKQWFPLGDYEIQGPAEMLYSWEQFCEIVKHKWRYTFPFVEDKYIFDICISPKNILDTIAKLLSTHKCISKVAPDIPIYRGRNFENRTDALSATAKSIGTPEAKFANKANRFSPEGIPMFYGCLDYDNVENEIDKGENQVIGEFYTSKEISVLDLTNLPAPPSLYDDERNMFISAIDFLHDFSRAISKDIEDDKKIDYVPTQIFTEYFRQIGLKDFNIYGIRYHSAKCFTKHNLVLFFENEDCEDEERKYSYDEKPYLLLKKITKNFAGDLI